jgi:hypothetical protein
MDPQGELADLQNRFHLLEGDRKTFYEQSQVTLKHNKQVADALRSENKDLRLALTTIHKERGSLGCSEGQPVHEAELARVEAQLTVLRQRVNQLISANKAKEGQLVTQVSPPATAWAELMGFSTFVWSRIAPGPVASPQSWKCQPIYWLKPHLSTVFAAHRLTGSFRPVDLSP